MQQFWILFFIAAGFVCCNNNSSISGKYTDSIGAPVIINDGGKIDSTPLAEKHDTIRNSETAKQCYAYLQNGDTIRLNITTNSDTFTGNLLYHLKEKDRSNGAVEGTIKGDTLIADYTFNAEGTQSVRQVAFIKQENNLKEGFGDVKEQGGKMLFINPKSLQFTGFLLTAITCN